MSDRTCIYIAARQTEATHVEQVLRQTHVAYAVEGSAAPSARFPSYSGMRFYVEYQQSRSCRQALHRAGLVKGMVGTA